jgi:hypothetical protein
MRIKHGILSPRKSAQSLHLFEADKLPHETPVLFRVFLEKSGFDEARRFNLMDGAKGAAWTFGSRGILMPKRLVRYNEVHFLLIVKSY